VCCMHSTQPRGSGACAARGGGRADGRRGVACSIRSLRTHTP
jgi:hypothetical protein